MKPQILSRCQALARARPCQPDKIKNATVTCGKEDMIMDVTIENPFWDSLNYLFVKDIEHKLFIILYLKSS